MRILNLSHPLKSGMPLFPGTKEVTVADVNTIKADGFRQKYLSLSSHVGTHVDAPAHVLADGMFLDQLPLDQFYGLATVLDASSTALLPIPLAVLSALDKAPPVDFVLFYTGWQKHWDDGSYYGNGAPYLSEPLAKALAARGLKGVGLDAPSADAIDSTELPVHRILFRRSMIIIENLIHLKELCGKYFTLSVFPLNIPEGDGSPLRAVAILDE